MLSKLTYVGKIMAKSTSHNGKNMCKGKDLLTECENWSRELNIQNVNKGCLDTNLIKKAVWAKTKMT